MDKVPYIVYASDDRFSEILGVSLVSLYENSKDADDIVVFILDSGISSENIKKINGLAEKYNRKSPVFIEAKNISSVLSMDVNLDRGSMSQYARLFVSSVLSEDIERVLYLDCDIIISKSILTLWNLDMDGNTVAALKDAFSSYYRKNINLDKHDVMFNSGVMLIDLKRWREKDIEKQLLEFITEKNGKIQQGDQGALNSVLSRDTFCFDPKFNAVTIFFDFTYKEIIKYRKPVDFYSQEKIKEAVDTPYIIHYTTSFISERPWYENSRHKYAGEWLKYKKMSPWSDEPLWINKDSGIVNSLKNTAKKLPKNFVISLARIPQIYGRPLYYKIKGRN